MLFRSKIHTIDINEELSEITERYLNEAGIKEKVQLYFGDALDIIPVIKQTFDLVFIDADKTNYSKYYDLVFDSVRKGGYIIADNVLWSGKVLDEPDSCSSDHNGTDEDTMAIIEFNKKVHSDNRVENVIFPIRDGLMVARKLV